MSTQGLYDRIYDLVRAVPPGYVTTYGELARRIGTSARVVGFAMAALPDGHDVPWHRVINSKGQVSSRSDGDSSDIQKILLKAEGVCFDDKQRVDLFRFSWTFHHHSNPHFVNDA